MDVRVVIDISWFGEADHRVDKNIGISLPRCSHCQLPVCAVHRITSLERNDFAPCKFFEMGSQFGRGDYVNGSGQ